MKKSLLAGLRAEKHVHIKLPLLWTVMTFFVLWEKLNSEMWHILLSLFLVGLWILSLSQLALPVMEEKEQAP